MQCRRTERGQLYQGLLRRAGKYRADELAPEGQSAAGRGADRRGRREAAGDRLFRAWLVGRALAHREYRCRRIAGMEARGASRGCMKCAGFAVMVAGDSTSGVGGKSVSVGVVLCG